MGYFNKTYHPPGTPPGTLVAYEVEHAGALSLRLIDYSNTEFTDRELTDAGECAAYLDRDSVTWIHVQGQLQTDTMASLGEMFALHPLAMEDVLNKGQRPKIEEYDEQLFVILSLPMVTDGSISMEQVSLFFGKNYIISFYSGSDDPFQSLRKRLGKQISRHRNKQADYLLYSIIDLIIDQGYPILESFGEAIENIEEELLNTAIRPQALAEIHRIRRELLLLRRSLWPQREIINSLLRDGNALINEGTLLYLRDCYDHTIQIMDLLETYRDMATSLIDVYLSSVSNRLNEVMRILTIIATIFIPLTFVVGLYGMNFNNPDSPWAMPELHWYYGYPLVWGIIIAIVVGMIVYFKRKNWL